MKSDTFLSVVMTGGATGTTDAAPIGLGEDGCGMVGMLYVPVYGMPWL